MSAMMNFIGLWGLMVCWKLGFAGLSSGCRLLEMIIQFLIGYLVLFKIFQLTKVAVKSEQHIRQI